MDRMVSVSIVVPCYNEQATIGQLLEAIYQQSYPRHDLEVIIADGLSTDATREVIKEFQKGHPDLAIRVVDNQKRIIPAGLNLAIEGARGDYIVRLDAHSIPEKNYIALCIDSLASGRGENVGGVWEVTPQGEGWIARSIALAAVHPMGVGDARYRLGGLAQWVDTVPFGAFERSIFQKIGFFNEKLLTNEDYEFNVRIRQAGGKIWLDPNIRSKYYSRPSLGALARQYWRYGYWKAQMLRKYPGSIRWRQLLPPSLVLSIIILMAGSIVFPFLRSGLYGVSGLYFLALLLAGIQAGVNQRFLPYLLGIPLAIATMHLMWGSAFLWGLLGRHK